MSALKKTLEEKNELLTAALEAELERPSLRSLEVRSTVYLLLRLGREDSVRLVHGAVSPAMDATLIRAWALARPGTGTSSTGPAS